MANDALRAGILDGLLREVSIPISGISVTDINAVPPAVTVNYLPGATQEQIDLGEQIKDAFDWRRRRALARSVVVTALQQLTTAQQNAILRHMVCDYLRNTPQLAAKIDAALGTSLPVDEIDPNP